jgi:hypothetical protein
MVVRAADDLNAVAERARRDPDPVDEARARLDALFTELETLIGAVRTGTPALSRSAPEARTFWLPRGS